MAQSDSQRSEFEEPDSLNLDSVVPADNGGEAPEPAKIDDSAAVDIRDEVADAFAEEEEVDSVDASEGGASSLPTPEELLAQAGSILNGGDFQLPVEEAEEEVLDEIPVDVEESELMAMPDPQFLMGEASGDIGEPEKADEEAVELMAMPDPQDLMTAASDSPGETPDQPRRVVGSNIADRAGDLPPPPPAPVCLDDAEIYVEEEVVEPEEPEVAEEVVAEKAPPATIEEETEEQPEPESPDDALLLMDEDDLLAEDSSLDGFNVGSAEVDAEEALADSAELVAGNQSHFNPGPYRGIVGRVLQSTALAAGLLFVGLGLTLAFVKEELYGFLHGGGLEGATLSWHVATIAKQVFDELEETRHYHAKGFSTEIRQASDTEVLIEVKMEAYLTSDLHLPVENALVYSQVEFERSDIEAAALFVSEEYPEKALMPPEQPWKKLYQLSGS